jgi:hypothetical protein
VGFEESALTLKKKMNEMNDKRSNNKNVMNVILESIGRTNNEHFPHVYVVVIRQTR